MFNKHQLSKIQSITNLVQENKFSQALKITGELIKKIPNNHILLNMNGFILFRMKNYELAKQFFLQSIQFDKNFFEAKFNLGRLFFYQEQYPKAIEFLSQAIKLNKNDLSTIFYLADSLKRTYQFEEAIDFLTPFINNTKINDHRLLNILATSYYQINHADKAEEFFYKALEIDPKNIDYLTMLGKVYLLKQK